MDNNEEIELGRAWKDYWRNQEKDPTTRRETRQAKKLERRRIHKKNRRTAKENLKDFY